MWVELLKGIFLKMHLNQNLNDEWDNHGMRWREIFPLQEVEILGAIALSGKDLAHVQNGAEASAAGAGGVS